MSIGFLGVVVEAHSSLGGIMESEACNEFITSSAPKTKQASLMAFVSTIHAKRLPRLPPAASPDGPPSN